MHAYRALQYSGKLADQQQRVLAVFYSLPSGKWTRKEIEQQTGIDINAVCGRVNELIKLALLVEDGKKTCFVTTNNVNALRLARTDEGGET